MTKICIICDGKEYDGHPEEKHYIVCSKCQESVEIYNMRKKEWEKRVEYRVQEDMACCFNCAHSYMKPDGYLYCEMAPVNDRWGDLTNVPSVGICNEYEQEDRNKWTEE